MQAFRTIGPYVVGTVVWGTSLGLMFHGLLVGAWYGYAYLLVFVVFGAWMKYTLYRIRKQVEAEFLREFRTRYVE